MKHAIRKFPRLWRATRLARRWYHARFDAYPDWRAVLAADPARWAAARAAAPGGPRVLMATAIGSHAHAITLESALAAALTLRGAEVHALLCDGAMTACAECDASLYPDVSRFVEHGPSRDLCRDCTWPAERVYAQLGLKVHRYSEWLTPDDRAEARRLASSVPRESIRALTLDDLAIGEHAYAGALRFFAAGSLDAEREAEPVLRRYLESALLTAFASRRLLRAVAFSSAVLTHGIYVPWGIVGEVARREGVHVVTWNVAYRKRRFIFSHDDTYHHTLMTEPREHWERLELSPAQDRELTKYLSSRRDGLFDWIVFHRPRRQDPEEIARRLGLDRSKPVIGLLTNVTWDAQLHYPANAFPGMLEWLVQTCEYFATRPDLQLLVRVHPAEISGFPPSRQPVLAELRRRLPQLAPNILVVPPESGMSTYALMSLCNAAIIYGTKMGVELTSIGLPVIVAGEAWIRSKGLTDDASSPAEYFRILARLPFPGRLDGTQLARARRYAYHFFFNRMIPLPFIDPKAGFPIYRLRLERLAQLLPGASGGLDTICNGILSRRPFVMEAGDRAAGVQPAARAYAVEPRGGLAGR
ncbi:MAG: capsule biosynthesis protein [Acidobacteria bacterium]|nr:capsule biosynthesis protein [Acidobacteriota bacterium]